MINKKEDCDLEMEWVTISHQRYFTKRLNRAKAIHLKCLDCCCRQVKEVKECRSYDCPLWRYRTGKEERDELYYQTHNKRNDDE